jgi:16S rRNA (adenine1518-N6/adenine1519-N6)-dimethyltransferase
VPQRLGQHFLVRDSVLEQLAEAAAGEHTARVVEIGPGRGALTRHLLTRTDELHAVELDTKLVAYLREKLAGEPKLDVHEGDILSTDIAQWGPAVITGNLPYYITSPLVEKFLRLDASFETAVFLMQWEVAERLLAKPGSRDYGYLTVATQLVCDVELVVKVPPAAFRPPPKVDSAGVKLRRRSTQPENLPELLRFVSLCFRQKRKTLRNNLRGVYGGRVEALPEASLRAEQIEAQKFAQLLGKLKNMGGDTLPVH